MKIIALLLLLVALVKFIYNQFKKEKTLPNFPIPMSPLFWTGLGLFFFFLSGLFFYAQPGTAYSVQYIWGGDKMIKTQGPKIKAWGTVIPITYEISVKDIILQKDKDGNYIEKISPNSSGIYNRKAQLWEFSDAIKADIACAVVIEVSTEDEEKFLKMADRNRSESKLIYGRVLPNIDAAIKNTCKLMDAQEYIAGKASDFDRYFRDQLANGMYLIEEYVVEEQTVEIIGDTNTIREIVPSKESSKQKKFRIKKDKSGNILRDNKSNSLTQYGINVVQANVTSIDWESSFDKRLSLQKEEVAQTQLEKQQAEKEFYRAKKEIAKGESEKAKERAALEKEQIKETIAAETRAKVAMQNLIAEKKLTEIEQYKAQQKKISADADYYMNSRLVSAGLTPQEKANIEKETAIGVAAELAKSKWPQIYFSGGDKKGNNNSLISDLIGAELAKKMLSDK